MTEASLYWSEVIIPKNVSASQFSFPTTWLFFIVRTANKTFFYTINSLIHYITKLINYIK